LELNIHINSFIISAILSACSTGQRSESILQQDSSLHAISILVLGTVQDGGSPHVGCKKSCCKDLFLNLDSTRKVACLGLIDRINSKTFLLEATPDLPAQLKLLKSHASFQASEFPNGIFVSHAHIGHYTGLMYLGKEAAGTQNQLVYTMPRMHEFLSNNGPWSQLVSQSNIQLLSIQDRQVVSLTPSIKLIPILVPHRDEYSETIGYRIEGPNKTALFIPDIDKWEKWEESIVEVVKKVDYAFIDATFYSGDELQTRDLSAIPHPFVVETMELFRDQPNSVKNKIHFIHLNHSNPLLNTASEAYKTVTQKGFHVAEFLQEFEL
jgi:pyrroloquinoline quinone biosynthesis protein B